MNAPAPHPADCRVERLHPPGTGALSVLRVHGPAARARLARVLDRGEAALPPPHRLRRAWITEDGQPCDEVVLAARGEHDYEITGHGGEGVVAQICTALARAGAQIAPTPPTPLPPLARARTWLAALFAALPPTVRREAFGDALPTLQARLLDTPARVVITGAVNAGKSSLLNALLDREAAIASPEAGTTRDVLRHETSCAGLPVELLDTAGVLEHPRPDDPHAAAAHEAAQAAIADADLRLVAIDRARPAPACARALLESAPPGRALLVWTKADLPAAPAAAWAAAHRAALAVSARTGEGLETLRERIAEALLGLHPEALRHRLEALHRELQR
ncbi:MAG: GTP-binding protein [Planctomycetota bacterium]|nr:MAG: GTP-binding protein [Planctomycetota bacterium]